MSTRSIYITENDFSRLGNLINETRRIELRKSEYLENLETELSRAIIVPSDQIPADVITMNSTVILVDTANNDKMQVTLVYPNEANIDEDKISILAPIGTAMIGYRTGDTFEWKVPDGIRRLMVENVVYQPEAFGKYEQ